MPSYQHFHLRLSKTVEYTSNIRLGTRLDSNGRMVSKLLFFLDINGTLWIVDHVSCDTLTAQTGVRFPLGVPLFLIFQMVGSRLVQDACRMVRHVLFPAAGVIRHPPRPLFDSRMQRIMALIVGVETRNHAMPRQRKIDTDDLPLPVGVDWDAMAGDEIETPADEILADELSEEPKADDAPEEDDDNPFQESDEALPDDAEERAIRRRNIREAGDPV